MSNALFKGSTAHQLSQEEINAFMDSIDFTPVNPSASRALSQNSQRITNQTENQNRQYTPQSKDYS